MVGFAEGSVDGEVHVGLLVGADALKGGDTSGDVDGGLEKFPDGVVGTFGDWLGARMGADGCCVEVGGAYVGGVGGYDMSRHKSGTVTFQLRSSLAVPLTHLVVKKTYTAENMLDEKRNA
jgi:hypothetical protein